MIHLGVKNTTLNIQMNKYMNWLEQAAEMHSNLFIEKSMMSKGRPIKGPSIPR